MDARSLVAVLAIVFLLWLIRTWIKWDSHAKLARQSSQRLRDRVINATLAERVGRSGTVPASATAATRNTSFSDIDDDYEGRACEAVDIADLREQLEQAQRQAAEADQNDLELRRLQGELESLHLERADAVKRIEALELRIREQQTALDAGQNRVPVSSDGSARGDVPVQGTLAMQESEIANDSQSSQMSHKVVTPLYQAPSQRDNLKRIKGIGPVMERTLNDLGVTTFQQLADFTQVDIDKVSDAIGTFPGRIERDDWVGKAQRILKNHSHA